MLTTAADPDAETLSVTPVESRARTIGAWCLYDWAITPYPTIVSTFIISNYFAKKIASDPTIGSAQWSFMIGVAGMTIAILSPPLGAIADRLGHAKRSIAISLTAIILAGSLLWFAKPDPRFALPVLVVSGAGIVAMELGLLFYNALLPGVAPIMRLGRISGWGWASGYAGGIISMIAALGLISALPGDEAVNIRASGPLAAVWAAVFGWPLFFLVPELRRTPMAATTAIRQGLVDLGHTLRNLGREPQLAWFLLASAIYRDGITTILAVGGLYAGGTFGLGFNDLVIFGISLNVSAGLGAALLAWIDDWIGSKRTIALSVLGLIVFGIGVVLVHDRNWFFGFALALGVFIGPAQASSRALAVRLAPEGQVGKIFGLYALTGRAVSFVGPIVFGWVTASTHSQRAGLASILVLLMIGLAVLTRVREPERHAV